MPINTIQISYNGKYENANFVVTDFNNSSKTFPISFFSDEEEAYLTFDLDFQEVNHYASIKFHLFDQTKNTFPEMYNLQLFTTLFRYKRLYSWRFGWIVLWYFFNTGKMVKGFT